MLGVAPGLMPDVAQPLNRGLAMAVRKKFPRFNIQFVSLNSRTAALKSRIKFCEVRPRFKCQNGDNGRPHQRPIGHSPWNESP